MDMKTDRVFPIIRDVTLLVGLLSFTGCDYWPPALQSHIEELQAELNDSMDVRHRLDQELTDLRVEQASLQREVEEKARENEQLQQRLAAVSRTPSPSLSARHGTRETRGRRVVSYGRPSPPSHIRKGSFYSLQLEQPHRRGPLVKRLQRLLRRHDLPIRVDGIYGPSTDSAIRSFQRVHGLPVDGTVGPMTYRALSTPPKTSRFARQLSLRHPILKGQDVTRIQRALRRAGYRIPVDGRFGPATDFAVSRFQRKHGLDPDGMVGPRTWAALNNIR